MSEIITVQFKTPSRRGLLWSVVAAMALAAVLLVVIVLPAEYGIDPVGAGARLGLKSAFRGGAPAASTTLPVAGDGDTDAARDPETRAPEATLAVSRQHGRPYRRKVVDIAIGAEGELEYKADIQTNDAILYTWNSDGALVYSDFHGQPADPENYPPDYFMRYREATGSSDNGSLVAPFSGEHGWYFVNLERRPVTVRLEMVGYFDNLHELWRSDPYGAENENL